MSEEVKIEFKTPKNPTDAEVVFDPEFNFSNIVVPLLDYEDGKPTVPGDNVNVLNVEGISEPLLKLNNKFIIGDQIYALSIFLTDFLPKIEVTINDPDKNIQATDVPGMNNVITVILTAPVNGASKKMSMDFYITECTFNEDNTILYRGEYKSQGFKQIKYTQIGDKELSTYEFLETVAKEQKLGFAATTHCKDIDDKKWRQLYSETYESYITKELTHAGIDENSIFDAWIDNFGYLVMVNLAYIFNEKVEPAQLSTKMILGETTTLPDGRVPEQEVVEIYRMISNDKDNSNMTNLHFSEYHSAVDNSKIVNKGTKNKFFYLSSPCDQNILKIENLNIVENSVDGMAGKDEYVYENIEFIGTNQSDGELCEQYQEEIRTNFINSRYGKSLIVTLDNANYSLQRGMLIYVMVNEYSIVNKEAIENNISNAFTLEEDDSTEAPKDDSHNKEIREKIIDESGMMNPALSGLYYIKDMTFSFTGGIHQISQYLTLIKKDLTSNLNNKYTSIKIYDL